MIEGYCVKCKAKRPIADAVEEQMKNGRKAVKGKCPVCGAVMFKILGGKAAPVGGSPAPATAPSPSPSPSDPPASAPHAAVSPSPSQSSAPVPPTGTPSASGAA